MAEATEVVLAPDGRARILPVNFMQISGNDYRYSTWFVDGLPNGHTFSDLFHPYYWVMHRRLRTNDLVRVVDRDGEYDVMLKVTRMENGGGAYMEVWPKFPKALGEQVASFSEVVAAAADATNALGVATMPREINGQPVPRIDHTAATQWRVIGLNGHPIEDGIKSKATATARLEKYAKDMKIEL